MGIVIGTLEQGVIYAILALGVMITYQILDFPDLTVDSSFPLGAAVSAVLTLQGMHPALTLLFATLAGATAGLVTGIIHVKCKVRDLLSGIITMTALYSVNLRIASKANVPIFGSDTLFKLDVVKALPKGFETLIVAMLILLMAKFLLDAFLKTKAGYLLRAVGDNDKVVTTLAKDSGYVKIVGLCIANGLVSLSGAVMCQQQRFFDISMGTGAIVIGLASVIIGTNLLGQFSILKTTTCVIFGSIVYKACVTLAISMGLAPNDMKLVTAVLFLGILMIGNYKKGKKRGKSHA